MGRLIRWTLALLVVTGIGFFIWQKTRPKPVEVVVQPVVRGVIEKTVANTRAGTVNACRRAKLSPSIGGQIAHLPVHWLWQSSKLRWRKPGLMAPACQRSELTDRPKDQKNSSAAMLIPQNRPITLSPRRNRSRLNVKHPELPCRWDRPASMSPGLIFPVHG